MALTFSTQQPVHAPAALPHCNHSRMNLGLDRAYCPDCKRGFTPRTPEYLALLNEASAAMVAQALAKADDSDLRERTDTPLVTSAQDMSGATPDSVSGADLTGTQKSAPDIHWLETYTPAKRKDSYYRYVWMEGRKLHHLHIRGGGVSKALAMQRKQQIEAAIKSGKSPAQIEQMIKSFTGPTS